MPETDTTIVNRALQGLGASAIGSLSEDSDSARIMNAIYIPTLDKALREGDWNFANVRQTLAQLASDPAWGPTRQYALPSNPHCLRVLEANLNGDEGLSSDEGYRIETYIDGSGGAQRVIVTDAASVGILYVARILDTSIYDALFAYALEVDLKFQAAYPITRNATLVQALQQEKEVAWRKAKAGDGVEGRKKKTVTDDSLLRVR